MDPTPEQTPELPNAERYLAYWVAFGSFLLIVAIFLPSQVLQFLNLPIGLVTTSLLVFGSAGLIFPLLFGQRPGHFTGISKFDGQGVLAAILLGAVNLPLAMSLMGAAQKLLPESWSKMAEASTKMLGSADGIVRVMIVLGAAVAAPIGEELFFRGWLLGISRRLWTEVRSALIVAVLFSAVHFDPVGLVARMELGILFGLLRTRTGSLWPSIAMHATHNGISTAILYLVPRAELEAQDSPPWQALVAAAALSLLVVLFVWRLVPTRETPEPQAERLQWRPRIAAPWIAVNAGLLVLIGALLAAFRHQLPGASLTSSLTNGSTPVTPLPGPDAKDGSRHLK